MCTIAKESRNLQASLQRPANPSALGLSELFGGTTEDFRLIPWRSRNAGGNREQDAEDEKDYDQVGKIRGQNSEAVFRLLRYRTLFPGVVVFRRREKLARSKFTSLWLLESASLVLDFGSATSARERFDTNSYKTHPRHRSALV